MKIEERNVRLIEDCAAFHTAHDVDALVNLFTKDVVYDDVPLEIVAKGHAELQDLFEATFAALPDWAMTLVSVVADQDRGAAEWIMSGTHEGDFPGYPATGRALSVRAAAIIQFSDGRISKWADFWSLSTFEAQLGFRDP